MPRASDPKPKPRAARDDEGVNSRLIAGILVAGVLLMAAMYGFHRGEQFLIRDTRFALNGPDNPDAPESLSLAGAEHASHRAIEAVFSDDFGRSVYLIPLADRRATLRTVDWIKDASVARLWPNRVVLNITERTPVGSISLGRDRTALIDEDGVILPRAKDPFTLPMLMGVRASDPIEIRRDRAQRLVRVMRELGDAGQKITQVDVSDRDNLKVSEPFDGRSVTLLLGDHNFGLRHQNFLRYYGEIQRKLPDAATLDLRVEDRITVVEH